MLFTLDTKMKAKINQCIGLANGLALGIKG